MGQVSVSATTPGIVLDQYPVSAAKPYKLYAITLKGEQQGPFTITQLQDGKVAFLLDAPLTTADIEWLTEYPPVRRIESTDGASIDRPTIEQVFNFLHDHVKHDVKIFL